MIRRLRPFILIVVVLAAWEAAARSGMWSKIVFPSLEAIGREFFNFFARRS
jgi:ABC-type nitrate/sulfonate/bicarbonate transport system permease component